MPYQKNASINTQKPVNIFYVWYSELCRRLNSSPAPVVKPAKTKCQTVLDFVGDRLKVEEWSPVINALRHDTSLHVIAIKSKLGNCQFLHEVDTEEKVRHMKRRYGTLWTAFILKSLLKSLSCTVRNTQVLTSLEFEGLPMFSQYLEPLMKALQKNKTLKTLSLSRCRVCDTGCQMVCEYVKFTPNIEVINLSGCGLTPLSGQYIARLIKYQQINRYCESWHHSLRYSDPNVHIMKGLKRITLNDNTLIGDEGLSTIINELDDDLWIKALDMQKCGITEIMGPRILDLVQYSQSLEIADFRSNDLLSICTIEKILYVLKEKHQNRQTEFHWCKTSFTLGCESVVDSVSNYLPSAKNAIQVHKTKSAPLKQICSRMTVTSERPVRRTKTSESVHLKNTTIIEDKVAELSCQLQEEIARRKETEKINFELMKRIEQFSSGGSIQVQIKPKDKTKTLINTFEKLAPKENGLVKPEKVEDLNPSSMLDKICSNKNGFKKNGVKNPHKNGYHDVNGYISMKSDACTILEKLIGRKLDDNKDQGEGIMLDYIKEQGNNCNNDGMTMTNGHDMTDSQVSLIKFMENLKKNSSNLPVKLTNRPSSSKCYVTDKRVKK